MYIYIQRLQLSQRQLWDTLQILSISRLHVTQDILKNELKKLESEIKSFPHTLERFFILFYENISVFKWPLTYSHKIAEMHLRAYSKHFPVEHAPPPPSWALRLRSSLSCLHSSNVFLPFRYPQRGRISLFRNLQVGAFIYIGI